MARAYRNGDKQGMERYSTWFRRGTAPRNIGPTDIDGMLHDSNGNRFLQFEFKPQFSELSIGQRILMEGFSKLPGCAGLAVFDPFWNEQLSADFHMSDSQELKVILFHGGNRKEFNTTVAQLNEAVKAWYSHNPKWARALTS